MCGRFTLTLPPEVLAGIFGLAELLRIELRYNIAPSQQVAAIRTLADNEHRGAYLLCRHLGPAEISRGRGRGVM